ncbi:MAG TPA: RusA family crossover junction endodeoxyribonuclease [Myxococcales bacterium]|nr:RusA family crossover junction endodeoxyribonuclease [Myxococcales bacterium]
MPQIIVMDAPVAKARPRFTNGHTYTPRATERAEGRIRDAWIAQVGPEPFTGPVILTVTAHLARPAGHYGKRGLRPSAPECPCGRPDWDNLAKLVSDALNGVAYRDDGQIVAATMRKRYTEEAPAWVISVEAA